MTTGARPTRSTTSADNRPALLLTRATGRGGGFETFADVLADEFTVVTCSTAATEGAARVGGARTAEP
jgi:hypothetical protein